MMKRNVKCPNKLDWFSEYIKEAIAISSDTGSQVRVTLKVLNTCIIK